jgi:ATP-dependent helicase/nuclease subunit A
VPSITGFLRWMQADDQEVKRQMDAAGDRIRVMTVHGAKGLEAPVVILPDCAARPVRNTDPLPLVQDRPIWAMSADEAPAPQRAAREAAAEAEQAERDRELADRRGRRRPGQGWPRLAHDGAGGDAGRGRGVA